MSNKTILVTGGAGFIGSHLINHILTAHNDYRVINLDSLTYAADLRRLEPIANNPNYKFIHGNICDMDLVASLFKEYSITDVMHLAAESHVDNSLRYPSIFVDTNVKGTANLLEAARQYWAAHEGQRFLHVSTDEVYGSLGATGYFSENTPYAPNSPYSASKAASDFLTRSYFHSFGLPVLISNCSNNYGPAQHDEKLIPTVIRRALQGAEIPIYGNGQNIRDWLYVLDHVIALDTIFHHGRLGDSYNIGTHNELTNIQIATFICKILDELKPLNSAKSYVEQITYVKDRPGHDFRYAIDNTKICTELSWKASSTFEDSMKATVIWYIDYYSNEALGNV